MPPSPPNGTTLHAEIPISVSANVARANIDRGTQQLSAPAVPQSRKSAVAELLKQPRRWLHVDQSGHTTYVSVDKHKLVHQLNVSYRDLRILDPMVATPYPCALLIRPTTLLINVEAVRMVVCRDHLYVLSVPDTGSGTHGKFATHESAFVQDLVYQLTHQASRSDGCKTQAATLSTVDQELPFELRAVDAALSAAVRILEAETSALEANSLPLLANLTQKVTRNALDKVRMVKFSMTKLETRINRVKSELENILNDDQDMLNMYLGRRFDMEQAAAAHEGRSTTDGYDTVDSIGDFATDAATTVHGSSSHEIDRFTPHDTGSTQSTDDVSSASMKRRQLSALSSIPSEEPADPVAEPQHETDSTFLLPSQRPRDSTHDTKQDRSLTQDSDKLSGKRNKRTLRAMPSAPHVMMSEYMDALLTQQAKLEALEGCTSRKFGRRATVDATTATAAYFQQLTGTPTVPDPRDIEACEGLLEVYFMQLDNLVSRLSVATSKVADTEDLISIDLDHRRNELVALNLVVNCIMVVFAVVSAVTGAFGMNLNAWMPQSEASSKSAFLAALLCSVGFGLTMSFGILAYARDHRLLFIANGTAT